MPNLSKSHPRARADGRHVAAVMKIPLLILSLLVRVVRADEAKLLTDVCFNGCSGHGTCSNFVCSCHTGWFGDDCRHSFAKGAANGGAVVPILGAGHFNLTTSNFTKVVKKRKLILVGFSSYKCHKCIMQEAAYAEAAERLSALGVDFARADADKFRDQLKDMGIHDMPALVVYRKGRPTPYIWMHSADLITSFVEKQLAPSITLLRSKSEVLDFANAALGQGPGGKGVEGVATVVGFFSDPQGMEEDEYTEFEEAVAPLRARADVFVGAVTDPKVVADFKGAKGGLDWVDRSPAVVVQRTTR